MWDWVFVPIGKMCAIDEQDLLLRLDPGEGERIAALRHPEKRYQSLCAHLLVRVLACTVTGLDSRQLHWAVNRRGKPHYAQQERLHISLSHTRGGVSAAVSSLPVGVDIETWGAPNLRIARRFFTSAEIDYIFGSETDQTRNFFRVWTRKEACIKWDGSGLSAFLSRDTTSAEWTARLLTEERGTFCLSACQEGGPGPLRPLSESELLRKARALPPLRNCPGGTKQISST